MKKLFDLLARFAPDLWNYLPLVALLFALVLFTLTSLGAELLLATE